jgi:c-di-GMP-binding flagellar brake protein YcgR
MNVLILSEGTKIQRREFYRIECMLPIRFVEVAAGNEFADSSTYMHDGFVKDISGGGMKFVTKHDMDDEARIRFSMVLEGMSAKHYIVAFGRTIDKKTLLYGNFRYQYNVQYYAMPDADQEHIVEFIFNEQRRVLSKIRWEDRKDIPDE